MTTLLRTPRVWVPGRAAVEAAPRVLFVGGGTGGHVYPALAIADALRAQRPDAVIAFAGTQVRLEWTAVPQAGYPIHPITAVALPRRPTLQLLRVPWQLMRGLHESLQLIRAFDPDVVVGTGGYVSGPVLLAAHLLRRPLLLQEQNAYPGITNRLLGRWAARIFVAFPEAQAYFPAERCVLVGNPVRAALGQVSRTEARRRLKLPLEAHVLLVFGGSLGSTVLNEAVVRALPAWLQTAGVYVLWQTGPRHYEGLRQRLEPLPDRVRLLPYIDDMATAYAAADLAVCRAGALTCSELMVTGKPAILVPATQVAADHQTRNAESMAQAGAAIHLPEVALAERLQAEVQRLLADAALRAAMAEAARRLARPHAARAIATEVLRWAEMRRAHPARRHHD